MFTGLIEEVGKIESCRPVQNGLVFEISSEVFIDDLKNGDSIAVDGVCLTVTALKKGTFSVEAVQETLKRSTLGKRKKADLVNLERPLAVGQRLGGHFVQGHVDGTGRITGMEAKGSMLWLTIQVPKELGRYIIEKGSIAVDGISLTVATKEPEEIGIAIIPYTHSHTSLQKKTVGDSVNIEVDMMAKYIENMISPQTDAKETKISFEWLKEQGFA